MIHHAGIWSFLGFGNWALEKNSTGKFIGDLGFADFKRHITPSLEDMMEGNWGLITEAHGKGYAAEALTAALVWPKNTASLSG
ncbi:MAG: hypothetical protein COB54_04205 [Alphaproteobacteria bacterium]|nr:MAG: hypothetical protein COB54_04205 [Alphaproteobacteria bacterium]